MDRRSFIKNIGGSGALIVLGGGALASGASAAGNPNNYIASGIGIYGAGYHCTSSNVYAQDRYNLSVRNIQRHLGVSADGVMGVRTDRAVRNFQRARGLSADGIVGPATASRLGLTWVSVSNW